MCYDGALIYHRNAEAQEIEPEVVGYHLELAHGILETCYADSATGSLIQNPTLLLVPDLASKRETIESEPMASKVEP